MERPDDIVGHKTFDTGEIDPETGFPRLRHEPLTRAEAEELRKAADAARARRAEMMPDEKAALRVMSDAYQRLREFGWNSAIYCPKDGTHFQAIEAGSTGIHDCSYQGQWPKGSWWIHDGDIWPSRPILFRRYPEDEARHQSKMAEAAAKFKAEQSLYQQACELVHHAPNCPAIGGRGDDDCECGAVEILDRLEPKQ